MSRRGSLALPLLLVLLAGCGGGPTVVPVTGTVRLKDRPLAHAVVNFIPVGESEGQGGHGSTDAEGRYVLTGTRGENGIPPGEYKVTISLRLRPDGSLPEPNVPPIESDATERLLPQYWDRDLTRLQATVAKDAATHDFLVELAPRP